MRLSRPRPQRVAAQDRTENVLLQWFKAARNSKVPVTGPVMMKKAEEFARAQGQADWSCSRSRIQRFNKRYNITYGTGLSLAKGAV